MMDGVLQQTLPPGKYVTELWGYKVGEEFKNHFGRKARIAYLYQATNGDKLLIYSYVDVASGVQLLQGPKRETKPT
jgi:hypothetical protein